MAAVRAKQQVPVGSPEWIQDELEQISQLCDQEIDDFTFSARNEVEWLNEHMADIFSNEQINLTELLKTPGKLRGKTPRTAYRITQEARQPLSDVFSADRRYNSPTREPTIISAALIQPFDENEALSNNKFPEVTKKVLAVTDSGYHGLSEDDMEVDQIVARPDSAVVMNPSSSSDPVATEDVVSPTRGRVVAVSFETANQNRAILDLVEEGQALEANFVSPPCPLAKSTADFLDNTQDAETALAPGYENSALEDQGHGMDTRSPSESSSPARPLVRKSSLTFASLPPRDTMITKKSIGNRVSRTSIVETFKLAGNRSSHVGRFTSGKSLGTSRAPETVEQIQGYNQMELDDQDDNGFHQELRDDEDAQISKLHNKSSTQRLHERINALSKTHVPRPKSIPASIAASQPSYPVWPASLVADSQRSVEVVGDQATESQQSMDTIEDDDDWIQAPSTSQEKTIPRTTATTVFKELQAQAETSSDQAILSTAETSFEPFIMHNKIGQSQTVAHAILSSTTPVGTPTTSHNDTFGTLSASKSKLQSIMRSARGLFTSSAGVSAQARLEATTNKPAYVREAGAKSDLTSAAEYPTLPVRDGKQQPSSPTRTRHTRSSTEKEERRKVQEAEEMQHKTALEENRSVRQAAMTMTPKAASVAELAKQKAVQPPRQSPRQLYKQHESQDTITLDSSSKASLDDEAQKAMPPPPNRARSQLQKPKDLRRPRPPMKEAAPKPKPQAVSIKVGTMSQRPPLTSFTSSSQETLPSSHSQTFSHAKKGNTASVQTVSSGNSFKGSVSSVTSKPKALLSAIRKKEQDEKESQRKLEQKQEIERKKATQKEEQQKQENEKQREKERLAALEQSRKLAQKQAVEKKRVEQQRAVNELASAHSREEVQEVASMRRPDPNQGAGSNTGLGAQDLPRSLFNVPMPNPAKPPPKRLLDTDLEDGIKSVRTGISANYQANDGKRRRTGDKEGLEVPFVAPAVRPTMAPPVRASMLRKDGLKSSVLGAPLPTPALPNLFAPAGLSQTKMTGPNQLAQAAYANQTGRVGNPDMSKFANGRIPFEAVPNPAQTAHKTPVQSKSKVVPPQDGSSPWPSQNHVVNNPESIHLEEIPTDSEEDSPDKKRKAARKSDMPSWVHTPNLNQRLLDQEEIDPDRVFGPMAPLNMEEMFPGDKRRLQKFRSRTSSANWFGQDKLTQEDIQNDLEERRKIRQQGGMFR